MDFYSSEDNSSDSNEDSDHLNYLSPLSVVHPMNGGQNQKKQLPWHVLWTAPPITVHTGKCYKVLIDSGAAISLIRYSTYQHIDNSFKTPIQPTTTKLNTADGSPMTAPDMTALHLRIADFKFTHYFVICNKLPDTELIFGIVVQKKFSISYAWDKEEILLYTKKWKILTIYKNL